VWSGDYAEPELDSSDFRSVVDDWPIPDEMDSTTPTTAPVVAAATCVTFSAIIPAFFAIGRALRFTAASCF
jgi:hypothetical protein